MTEEQASAIARAPKDHDRETLKEALELLVVINVQLAEQRNLLLDQRLRQLEGRG